MQQRERCNAGLNDHLSLFSPFFPNPEVYGTDHLGANLILELPIPLTSICHLVSLPLLPRPPTRLPASEKINS